MGLMYWVNKRDETFSLVTFTANQFQDVKGKREYRKELY